MASRSYLPVAEFAKALEAAGVISDLDSITRVVIDLDPRDCVKVYVERIGAPALKDVAGLLGQMMRDGRAEAEDAAIQHQETDSGAAVSPRPDATAGAVNPLGS